MEGKLAIGMRNKRIRDPVNRKPRAFINKESLPSQDERRPPRKKNP
jgi:hypothetical protein